MADKIEIPNSHENYIILCLAHDRCVNEIVENMLLLYNRYYRDSDPVEVRALLEKTIIKIKREEQEKIEKKALQLPPNDVSYIPIANLSYRMEILMELLLAIDNDNNLTLDKRVTLQTKVLQLASKMERQNQTSHLSSYNFQKPLSHKDLVRR